MFVSARRYQCFNLKALTKSINIKKGAVYKAMLARELETDGAFERVFDVRRRLEASFAESDATGRDEAVAAAVASGMLRELRGVAAEYVERLQGGLPPGPRAQRTLSGLSGGRVDAAAAALGETVKELSGRIVDEA